MEKPEDLSDGESDTLVEVRAVLDVIDVFVSLSSVVIEFCHFFRVALIGKMLYRSFFPPKSVHIVAQLRRKR